MRLKIYIEGQVIDLFNDETVELTSTIANTEDITKAWSDYTRTFTVPASDTNNKLFKHYYNADIDNTFDARTKKNCRIELDGFPFRMGKMRLDKVVVKSGRAHAYTISFWGNLVSFKDLVKDDELSSLDLSAYDHLYNYENVRNGLMTGLFDKNIIYTLMSQNRQYMYSSDPANNTDTENLVNIAYNGAARGVKWNELKPSIRLLAIIEAIEAKYGVTFSRDFFGRQEFTEQYMWLNNNTEGVPTEQMIDWATGDADEVGLDFATNTWIIPDRYTRKRYNILIIPQAGFENIPYKIIVKKGDGAIQVQVDGTGQVTTDYFMPPVSPSLLTFHVSAASTFNYIARIIIIDYDLEFPMSRTGYSPVMTITDNAEIKDAMPKMKIIDFLKGLFTMSKLVVIPDENNNVYINNIEDYYAQGNIYDITKYVDAESYEVARGNIFNSFSFKYQEPTTILNSQFKINNGVAYGDAVTSLADADGKPLDGEPLEMQLPFEQVLYERLWDVHVNRSTEVHYGLILNPELKTANPKPVLFYNNPVSLYLKPISLLNASSASVKVEGFINTPAHSLGFDNPAFTLLWGAEFSTWNGAYLENSLFKNYWYNYVSAVFNVKKRNFKFKANLPTHLLTKIKLNDVLFIKERYYRINDFTVNLATGDASLNLMNTFEKNFGVFRPSQDIVSLTSAAQRYGVYVSNGSVMNFDKEDIGFGTDWATVTKTGNNVVIEVTANETSDIRMMYINVNNGAGKAFQIFLDQQA